MYYFYSYIIRSRSLFPSNLGGTPSILYEFDQNKFTLKDKEWKELQKSDLINEK